MSINGFWSIACQLLLLNRIRKWLGIARAYKVLSFGWIPVFLVLPLLRDLLEKTEAPLEGTPAGEMRFGPSRGWPVSIGINLVLSFVTIVGMSNSLLMVLINFASPDRSALGAVNGIATAVSVSRSRSVPYPGVCGCADVLSSAWHASWGPHRFRR